MLRAHLLATLTSIAALLTAASCGSDRDSGAGGAGGTTSNSTAGRGNGGAGGGGTSSGGMSNGGATAGTSTGGTSGGGATAGAGNGGQSNGGAGGEGGAAGEGGASGASGESGAGGVEVGGAAGASGGDAGVTSAGDGEPCPNGECGAGLVCIGYGGPLPNGESTACRRQCTSEDPPPHCTCLGGGFCEQSVGDPDAGSGTIGCAETDAGCTCGEVIVNAGCADADDATTDFQSGEFQGCLHWRDLGEGQGWIQYETFGGFHYDLQTSLGWVLRSSGGAMTLAQAAEFCAGFEIQGLSDWRLPTIDEARSLAGGCAETAPGGSCALSDGAALAPDAGTSSCLTASCGFGDDCTSCRYDEGPYAPGNYYCRPDVKVCSTMHTSSLCPDCPTPGDWRYGVINGNFFSASVDQTLFPVCVMENIPRAVPCRN